MPPTPEHPDVEPLAIYGETRKLIEAIAPILDQEPNLLARQFALVTLLGEVVLLGLKNRHPLAVADFAAESLIAYVRHRLSQEAGAEQEQAPTTSDASR